MQDLSSERGTGISVSMIILRDRSVVGSSPLKFVLCRNILPVNCLFPKFNRKSMSIKNIKVLCMGINANNFQFTMTTTIVATRVANTLCNINLRA